MDEDLLQEASQSDLERWLQLHTYQRPSVAPLPDRITLESGLSGRDYVRELVRQRDGRTCQRCGREWKQGQRRFDVHHIFECGEKSMEYDRLADLPNMITYCHRCHMTLEIVQDKMRNKSGNFKHSPQGLRRAG